MIGAPGAIIIVEPSAIIVIAHNGQIYYVQKLMSFNSHVNVNPILL